MATRFIKNRERKVLCLLCMSPFVLFRWVLFCFLMLFSKDFLNLHFSSFFVFLLYIAAIPTLRCLFLVSSVNYVCFYVALHFALLVVFPLGAYDLHPHRNGLTLL